MHFEPLLHIKEITAYIQNFEYRYIHRQITDFCFHFSTMWHSVLLEISHQWVNSGKLDYLFSPFSVE